MSDNSTDFWRDTSLAAEVELLAGFPFQSTQFTDDPTHPRLLRGDNVAQGLLRWDSAKRWRLTQTNGMAAYELNHNDVVVAMDRPWIEAGLKYAWVRHEDLPCLLVQRVSRLRCKQGMDQTFLRYVIGSRDFTDHVLAVQTGTSIPHISAKQILQFGFRCPPLAEQRAIARVLGALDDKMELNRRLNRSLEELAQAVFRSWFVDFDPVTAKASGRPPIGLDPATAALFPDHFQDSELGQMPQGWRALLLEDAMDSIIDYRGKTPRKTAFGVPLITAKIVKKGRIESFEEYISPDDYDSWMSRGLPKAGDIVMTTEAPLGEIAQLDERKVALAQRVITLRGKRDILENTFLRYLMQSPDFQNDLQGRGSGTTVIGIRQSELRRIPLSLPPIEQQQAFARIVVPMTTRIDSNWRESERLAAARDALLPPLLSGELRVPDAERFVGQLV